MRVFLLTSHPVAPPWNSGDTNLARTLVTISDGVDFAFVGDRYDPTPWSADHERVLVGRNDHMPSSLEKLKMLFAIAARPPQADVVHMIVTLKSSRLTPRVLRTLPVLRRRPWIATWPARGFIARDLLEHAHTVVALSEHTAALLRRAGIRRVRHVPPGVDLRRCQPEGIDAGWRQLGEGEGPFLLFAGHHDEAGGLVAALDLVARVRAEKPGVRLVTAMRHRPGENPLSLRRRMHALARDRGLENAIVELGPMANMRAAILACHAVLYQPVRLGLKMDLPLTLLEALAFGRPLVVSPVETLPEIGTEPAVMIGRPHDRRVVGHICRLLDDDAFFEECSDAARRRALERYDAAVMASRYRELYAEAAATTRVAVPA